MHGEMVMVPVLLRAQEGKHRCGVFMNIITMQYSKDTLSYHSSTTSGYFIFPHHAISTMLPEL